MKIKFSEQFIVQDFEEGKIIVNHENLESFYVEEDLFNIFKPALDHVIDWDDLDYSESYDNDDIKQFVFSLIELGILVKISD